MRLRVIKESYILARESYIKYNSLMLVQGNVGNFKKLGVVIGCSLDNSPLQNSPFSHPQMYYFYRFQSYLAHFELLKPIFVLAPIL